MDSYEYGPQFMQTVLQHGRFFGTFFLCKTCAKVKGSEQFSQEDFIHHVKLLHCDQQNDDDLDFEDEDENYQIDEDSDSDTDEFENSFVENDRIIKNKNDYCDNSSKERQNVNTKTLKLHGKFLEFIGTWACETCAETKGSPEFKTQYERNVSNL